MSPISTQVTRAHERLLGSLPVRTVLGRRVLIGAAHDGGGSSRPPKAVTDFRRQRVREWFDSRPRTSQRALALALGCSPMCISNHVAAIRRERRAAEARTRRARARLARSHG